MAKAQEARDELHTEILKKYGSQADLDMHCKGDTFSKKGGPRDLRRRYGAATKELRLAKSDLARMRNEDDQMKGKKKEFEMEVADRLRENGFDAKVGEDGAIEVRDSLPLMEAIDKAAEEAEAKREARQTDLEGNVKEPVRTSRETKEYFIYETEMFKVRISKDSWEKLIEKSDNKVMAWIQGHMRLQDAKRPIAPGVFDRDAKTLYEWLMGR